MTIIRVLAIKSPKGFPQQQANAIKHSINLVVSHLHTKKYNKRQETGGKGWNEIHH